MMLQGITEVAKSRVSLTVSICSIIYHIQQLHTALNHHSMLRIGPRGWIFLTAHRGVWHPPADHELALFLFSFIRIITADKHY